MFLICGGWLTWSATQRMVYTAEMSTTDVDLKLKENEGLLTGGLMA